jgi:tRNA A58 N-methylase Trm61
MYGEDWIWDVYGRTLHSVMTGSPAFEHVHDCSLFEYMRQNSAAAATFNRGMTAFSEQEAAAILRAYDFSGTSTIVDVGGGQGALLAAILKAHPQARGVLLETSNVIESAREALARAAVADRCSLVAGDFFAAIPRSGDIYVLKSVLHNWDANRSVAILQNCRRAIDDTGRLLVIERLVPDGRQPSEAKLFDMNMLVMVGALERTTTEYRALFQKSGFELARVIPTGAAVSVLEATGA